VIVVNPKKSKHVIHKVKNVSRKNAYKEKAVAWIMRIVVTKSARKKEVEKNVQ